MKMNEIFGFGEKDPTIRHAPAVYHLPDGTDDNDTPRDWVVIAGNKTVLSGKTRAEARKAAVNPLLIKKYGKLHIQQKK